MESNNLIEGKSRCAPRLFRYDSVSLQKRAQWPEGPLLSYFLRSLFHCKISRQMTRFSIGHSTSQKKLLVVGIWLSLFMPHAFSKEYHIPLGRFRVEEGSSDGKLWLMSYYFADFPDLTHVQVRWDCPVTSMAPLEPTSAHRFYKANLFEFNSKIPGKFTISVHKEDLFRLRRSVLNITGAP